jgi:hypothetical protein
VSFYLQEEMKASHRSRKEHRMLITELSAEGLGTIFCPRTIFFASFAFIQGAPEISGQSVLSDTKWLKYFLF